MIDRLAATEIARSHLSRCTVEGGNDLILLEASTIERPFAWVFFYNSRRFLETGDFRDYALGNSPLIVDRRDGSVHLTGTAEPVERYIREYEESRP